MLRVEVDANLARALSALRRAEGGTASAMQESASDAITGTWKSAVLGNASTSAERKLIATGSFAEVQQNRFTLFSGLGDPLSGGLGTGYRDWAGIEFGMTPVQSTRTKRRKKIRIAGSGREMTVATIVWVGKNLRPRNPDGYAAMPAARTHGPKFVAAWVYGLIGQFDSVDGTALDIEGS